VGAAPGWRTRRRRCPFHGPRRRMSLGLVSLMMVSAMALSSESPGSRPG
jgi:hypothetical protein